MDAVTADRETRAAGLDRLVVRLAEPGDGGALAEFGRDPCLRHLCREPDASARPGACGAPEFPPSHPALMVVATVDGSVVAAGWLEPAEAGQPAWLGIAVEPAWQHLATPALLRNIAGHAAKTGMTRLRTRIARGAGEPLEGLHNAGLAVASSVTYGGATEVELHIT
jgi:hypothetical protein